MDKLVKKLLLYSNIGENSILAGMAEAFSEFREYKSYMDDREEDDPKPRLSIVGFVGDDDDDDDDFDVFGEDFSDDEPVWSREEIIGDIYREVKKLLDLGTDYGFDRNLWQDYLTFVIMTNENSFSMITERAGEQPGSVDHFAKADFKVFMELFHYDFSEIESMLGIDCFSVLTDYKAIAKKENRYNRNVSDLVRSLSANLAEAKDENEFFDLVTAHYRKYGVGMIGLNAAFRVQPLPQVREDDDEDRSRMRRGAEAAIFRNAGDVDLVPIYNTDKVLLSDLVGYELQKAELRRNTEAFLAGKASNNVLLYGDAGTGKSSSVKALINEYYDSGLRVIEIYKHQFKSLSAVLARIKNRNFRFIIFIDDLSFEENEVEYKYLKAVIEGGVEDRPENVVIYATSNRRHLVKETWKDRADMEHNGDVHRSDTVEEKLSLAARFGVKILYTIPRHNEFQEMVLAIARRRGLDPEEWPDEKLLSGATAWERRAGGPTGRAAHQYITYLMAQ